MATVGGAAVLDPARPRLRTAADRTGLAVGDVAERLVVEGESPAAAVMDRSRYRTVVHAGLMVADGLELVCYTP